MRTHSSFLSSLSGHLEIKSADKFLRPKLRAPGHQEMRLFIPFYLCPLKTTVPSACLIFTIMVSVLDATGSLEHLGGRQADFPTLSTGEVSSEGTVRCWGQQVGQVESDVRGPALPVT